MRILTALLLLILAGAAAADIVHLRSGGKVEGEVVDKGDRLEIRTANGTVTIDKADVARIEKKAYAPPAKAAPAKKDVRLGPTYAHPFYAFKLWLPPKWARGKEHGSATMSFYGPKDQFYHPRMDLKYESSKKELVELVNAYKEAFRKAFDDAVFLFEEATAVRGRTGYQFCVLFSEDAIPQQAIFSFLAEGDRKYVLSFNCTQAWFERYYGQIDASMKSLRLYPMPAASTEEKQAFLTAYNKGEQAYREGRLKDALEEFQAAASVLPEFGEVHTTLGTVHLRLQQYAEAEKAYRRAIEIDPDDAAPHYNLGVGLLRQSKFDAAIVALKRTVELEPASEPGLTNLGAAYLGRGLDDPARQVLEQAVKTDPESAAAHYNLGLAYERLDRPKDAEREFKEALSADPKHEDAKKSLDRIRKK